MAEDTDSPEIQLPGKPDRPRPLRNLPTERVSFEKQLSVLRGYAAASAPDRKTVSNADVGVIVNLSPNSISLCNPFWIDIGLLLREGNKQRPADAVFDYFQAYQWHPESSAEKLAPLLEQAWFSRSLLPKLSFKSLSKSEAIRFLAEEVKAPKEYEANLGLILDYMKGAGIISLENATVTLIQKSVASAEDAKPPLEDSQRQKLLNRGSDAKTFRIPIPEKADAIIELPRDLDADDWEMLSQMLQTYVERWKKFPRKRDPNTE
jgi:hypothetical protein